MYKTNISVWSKSVQCEHFIWATGLCDGPIVCSALAFCEPEQNKQFEKWRDGPITF